MELDKPNLPNVSNLQENFNSQSFWHLGDKLAENAAMDASKIFSSQIPNWLKYFLKLHRLY